MDQKRFTQFIPRKCDPFIARIETLCPKITRVTRFAELRVGNRERVGDAPFSARLLQQRLFNSFRQFLQERPTRAQVDAFRSGFPGGLTEGECALLADTEAFLDDAWELPPSAREVVFGAIGRMAAVSE